MCLKTTSHRRLLGFCGDLETVSVLAPTAYERVQNRQYTGQIDVAVEVRISKQIVIRYEVEETHQERELSQGSGGLSQVQLSEVRNRSLDKN